MRASRAGVGGAAIVLTSLIFAGQPTKDDPPTISGAAKIRLDATGLVGSVKTDLARGFLAQAAHLPSAETRTLYRDEAKKEWYSKRDADALPEEARASLKSREFDEDFFYNTKYGSPLAYVRALEVVAASAAEPPVTGMSGRKVLDYGYGGIGHLRMLAGMGAEAVGVDVDTFLRALYSEPGDQGTVKSGDGRDGSVRLVHGFFPAGPGIKEKIGAGYDLFVSKNTLKMGYIHPARPVDPARLVQLGVDDREFVKTLYEILKPGGVALIYNLSPAPSKPEEEYKPWSDGRCPFARDIIESVGFKVIAFDTVDSEAARGMGRSLQWDAGGMDLEKDLFAHYTIFQKPVK